MKLGNVTITGADERTRPYDLCELYDDFPFVEWGILCSHSREGKDPRYPSRAWIEKLLDRSKPNLPLAGHLCGKFAREAVHGPFTWAINRHQQFTRFTRLQLNGVQVAPSTLDLVSTLSAEIEKTFVLQINDFDCFASGYVFPPKESVEFLVDASGGRGKPLDCFSAPPDDVLAGYSGGIGPDNIREVLERLTAIESDHYFWIDMESGVRTDDWFDLAKVEACLKIAAEFSQP